MEAGAVHHTPHFHADYQEHVAVFSLDPIDMICRAPSDALSRRGQNFTPTSSRQTGFGCKQVGRLPIAPLQ